MEEPQAPQMRDGPDGTVIVEIREPYRSPESTSPGRTEAAYDAMRKDELKEITFRRIYIADLIGMPADFHPEMRHLIIQLSGMMATTVDRMGLPDFTVCQLAIMKLRQKLPPTGGK